MTRLLLTILIISAAWGLSGAGYFWLSPRLDADIGYNDAPVFFAAYYGVWSVGVALLFRRDFLAFSRLVVPAEHLATFAAALTLFALYALFVIPHLPPAEWTRDQTPVEFFWAGSWYFLPKSVEILFQQVLIAALILALNALNPGLLRLSVLVSLLFGGFHLSLALSYDNPVYVLRYSVAAALFGAILPWLILRVRSGFLIAYAIHWCWYAVDIAVIHLIFSAD